MENEEIVKVARVRVGDDGIARVIHIPNVELTLADAKETMAAYLKLSKGKRCPLYVDTRGMRSISRDTRYYYASEEAAKCASAVALIVDTPVSRVLGNFYLGLSHPHLPTRLFTSDQEALALDWLRGYLE